ncbi:MAG: NUDIX hydrolase [Salinigranum sp.]
MDAVPPESGGDAAGGDARSTATGERTTAEGTHLDSVPPGADRDFTASAFVVSEDREVLLVDHRKLGRWIQPGGHVEANELPDEAAIREVREETGVEIRLLDVNGEGGLVPESRPLPWDVNLHVVRPDHWHCDFTYLAAAVDPSVDDACDEHDGVRWFAEADLLEGEFEVDDATRRRARAALRAAAAFDPTGTDGG